MITWYGYILVGLAAVAAGLVNALAGGGTLITFPMLTAVGVPAIAASVTNKVALCSGYFGAMAAQARQLKGQESRLWWAIPAGIVGGLIGGVLLLRSSGGLFESLVPWFILLASALLAVQGAVRQWISRRAPDRCNRPTNETWVAILVTLTGIYGGYFGAGLGVINLAVLGLSLDDTLTRLNALKQAIAISVNLTAAILFLFSGRVVWSAAIVMAAGSLVGGALGGKLMGKIKPETLRWTVVAIGIAVAVIRLVG